MQSWCCGLPSLFVPGFLQMEGRVRLHGLSSQRPSCTSKARHKETRDNTAVNYKQTKETRCQRESICPLEGPFETLRVGVKVKGFTHGSPDGHTILLGVAEVVWFKGVPVGEDDGRVVSPLEVHLHIGVMEPDP